MIIIIVVIVIIIITIICPERTKGPNLPTVEETRGRHLRPRVRQAAIFECDGQRSWTKRCKSRGPKTGPTSHQHTNSGDTSPSAPAATASQCHQWFIVCFGWLLRRLSSL